MGIVTMRSIYCSTCKVEKESGRENESRCKKCKSDAYKANRMQKRANVGLRTYGSGRKEECSKCGKIKENRKFGYCNSCNRERENAYRIRTGKTKNHRTGKCKCGNDFAPYSNYLCSKCVSSWRRNYFLKNPDKKIIQKRADDKRRYSTTDSFKIFARQTIRNALRRGIIKKAPCEICGDEKSEAHHDDYMKPLEVRWLCRKHHVEHHNIIKNVEDV